MTELLLWLILASVASTGAFLVYRLNQIHILVNSRMSGLLKDIKVLKERFGVPPEDEPEPTDPRSP
jgi:hypothetical protein